MLNLNAFESGMLFEQQLIEDESLLRYGPAPISGVATATRCRVKLPRWSLKLEGPQALLRDINRYLQGEAPVIKAPPPDDETLASRHAQIVARIDTVKQQWRDAVGELDALIESSGIDRRKFNRSNQAKWIEKISARAEEETNSYQLPESLEKFSQRFLEDRTKAGETRDIHCLRRSNNCLQNHCRSVIW